MTKHDYDQRLEKLLVEAAELAQDLNRGGLDTGADTWAQTTAAIADLQGIYEGVSLAMGHGEVPDGVWKAIVQGSRDPI